MGHLLDLLLLSVFTYLLFLGESLIHYLLLGVAAFLALNMLRPTYRYLIYALYVVLFVVQPESRVMSIFILPFLAMEFPYPLPLVLLFLTSKEIALLTSFSYLLLFLRRKLVEARLLSMSLRDEKVEDTMRLEEKLHREEALREQEMHLAVLGERERISRDLHNSLGHTLTSGVLQTQAMLLMSQDEGIKELLLQLQHSLKQGMEDTRTTLHALQASSFSLSNKIEEIQKTTPLELHVQLPREDRLSLKQKLDLLSIIKESTTNSLRHGGATQWNLVLQDEPHWISIDIWDNGKGGELKRKGMGLLTFEELTKAYQGEFYFKEEGFHLHMTWRKESNEDTPNRR